MSFRITPQEMLRAESTNFQVIRTQVPKEEFDDRGTIILPRTKRSGLAAGDHLLVQCVNREGTELLYEADYVVTKMTTEMRTVSDDTMERISEETTYTLLRWSDWLSPKVVERHLAAAAAAAAKPAKAAA